MTQEVQRNYLEINSIQELNEVVEPNGDYCLNLLEILKCEKNIFLTLNPYFEIDKSKILK